MSTRNPKRAPGGAPGAPTADGGQFVLDERAEAAKVDLVPAPTAGDLARALDDLATDEWANFAEMVRDDERHGGDGLPDPTLDSLADSAEQMSDDIIAEITGQPGPAVRAALAATINTHGPDSSIDVLEVRPEQADDANGGDPCEVDGCDKTATACECGASHCSSHPHEDEDDDDYEPESTEAEEQQVVTDEILKRYPTATRWEVKTTDEYDDGYFYDDSEVRVTYVDDRGKTVRDDVDLSKTGAADALRELADIDTLSWESELSVTIVRPAPEAPTTKTTTVATLRHDVAAMDGTGTLALTIAGTDFTIYYDERPSRGDLGGSVPGSVTGEYEVGEGPLVGGKGVVFRQHVSPTGQGSDTKGYAADMVNEYVLGRARRMRQLPSGSDLDRAVLAHNANPTTANLAAVMDAQRAHVDAFNAEQRAGFQTRTHR